MTRSSGPSSRPGWAGRGVVGHDLLQRRLGVRAGLDPEFAFEDGGAPVIGADRSGSVTQLGLQRHQGPVADFLERSEADPPPRRIGGHQRGGQLAAQPARQVAQLDTFLGLLLSQREQPVVVDPGQEVAAVRLQRGLGLGQPGGRIDLGRRQSGASGLLEDPDIDPAGVGVAPAEMSGGDFQ